MKTYSSKATAKRGAIRAISKILGLSQDEVKAQFDDLGYRIIEDSAGRFTWANAEKTPAIKHKLVNASGDEMPPGTYPVKITKVTSDSTGITVDMELAGAETGRFSTKNENKSNTPKKIERVHKSDIESPCKLVWDMADEMKGQRRKDIIAACVEKGVAYNTARTQYQLWFTATKNSQVA